MAQDEMQLMALDGGPPLPLFALGSGKLTLPPIMAFFQQEVAIEDDRVRLTEFGSEDVFEADAPISDVALEVAVGTYRSDAAEGTLEVRGDGTVLASGERGRVTYRLEPIARCVWRATPVGPFAALGAVVTFRSDGSLALTGGRMVNLSFHRVAS
jgi:hypothetical protein